MTKIYFLFFILIKFTTVGWTQNQQLVEKFDSINEIKRLDFLKNSFGINKKMAPKYELQTLIALSFYPELTNESIVFVEKKYKLPYAARPIWTSFFPFKKKKYKIIISTNSTEIREPTLLKNMPFNAQIGAIGHELAHVAYYHKTSKRQILWDGIRYGNLKFREKFEKMTDRIALEHGLAPQLLAWNRIASPTKKLEGKRGRVYYSTEEMEELIKNGQFLE
jgi:hypothetical protein